VFAFTHWLSGWGCALTLTETQTRNQALEHFSIEITRCWIFFMFFISTLVLFLLDTHFSHVIPTVLSDVHVCRSVCFLFWSVFHFRMPNVRTVINFMAQTEIKRKKAKSMCLGARFRLRMGHEILYSVYFSFI